MQDVNVKPEIPLIISVDDHVLEPPNLFQDRVPSRYRDLAPHVERRRIAGIAFKGASSFDIAFDEAGDLGDCWIYERSARDETASRGSGICQGRNGPAADHLR
jgi:hypothetical protein